MRIVHLTKWYLPYTGGVERVVSQLASGTTNGADEVRVLTCHREVSCGVTKDVIRGVSVIRAPTLGTILSTPVAPTFIRWLNRQGDWADILHFHVPFPLAEAMFCLQGEFGGSAVATYHADPAGSRWRLLEPLYRPVLSTFLDQMDAIAVTSPQMADFAAPLDGVEDKCEIIPLGVPSQEHRLPEGAVQRVRERVGVMRDSFVVLFVGRLVYYKGLTYLIEAIAKLPDKKNVIAVIVGEGPMREELVQAVRSTGIDDRVSFLGFVSEEVLEACYQIADVFVLPSIQPAEAFGLVQVEAMMHGVPVINTQLRSGVPFVSRDGISGITVEPANSDELADAVRAICDDRSFRDRLGKGAVQLAEQFTQKRMVERYRSLYERVAG